MFGLCEILCCSSLFSIDTTQLLNIQIATRWSWVDSKLFKVSTLRPEQNGCYSADNVFKYIFLNEDFWNWNKMLLKVSIGSVDVLSSNWWLAITWTNVDQEVWCHTPLLYHSELILSSLTDIISW